jgi:hypothetical protein
VPSLNLTHRQIVSLASGLKIALDQDEGLALIADKIDIDYPAMPGSLRRELFQTWAVVDAVAREHTNDEAA